MNSRFLKKNFKKKLIWAAADTGAGGVSQKLIWAGGKIGAGGVN